jgi:hypothetical protein
LSKNGPNRAAGACLAPMACFGENVEQVVGVTGVEPVTLRLSSACSNQLSYTPGALRANFRFQICDLKLKSGGAEETRTPDL